MLTSNCWPLQEQMFTQVTAFLTAFLTGVFVHFDIITETIIWVYDEGLVDAPVSYAFPGSIL